MHHHDETNSLYLWKEEITIKAILDGMVKGNLYSFHWLLQIWQQSF